MPTVYAALGDRLLVTEGAAEPSERLTGRDIECVAASGETVLVGTFESGLFVSEDGGDSFEQRWPGEASAAVTSVALSPHDPDRWWAGTEPSAVYRSTDRGADWQRRGDLTDLPSAGSWSFPPRPDTHHVRWIEPDPHSDGRLYVAIEAGALLLTDDGGQHWQDHPEGARLDTHTMATHDDAPGRVYAAAGDGYAESTDAGAHWDHPQEGLDHRYVWGVAVDPADPDRVVVSAASGAYRAHSTSGESYVYARRANEPWTVAMDGLPDPDGLARAELTTGPDGAFYALSNHGLARSASGQHWEGVSVDWRDSYRQIPMGLAVV